MRKRNRSFCNNVVLFIVGIFLALSGCDIKTQPYETEASFDHVRHFAKGGSRVCILSFTADPRLSQQGSGGPLQAARDGFTAAILDKADVAKAILQLRYRQYLYTLSSKYEIVGTMKPILREAPLHLDHQLMTSTIKSNDADYGIIVHDQYGVDWGSSLLTKTVEAYNFRVSTTVYTADGTLVWRFVSRGKAENPRRYSEPLAYAVIGKKGLSATNAVDVLDRFIKYYPKLEESLIVEDACATPHVDEFSDWSSYIGMKPKELAVFIVNDNSGSYGHLFRDIK